MINRKLDSPLRTRLNIRFVPKDKLNKIVYKDKYQIVQICWDHLYRKNHILFTTHFTPMNFRYQYQEKLNHNSKIIILGD
jgi:hypothetical protein